LCNLILIGDKKEGPKGPSFSLLITLIPLSIRREEALFSIFNLKNRTTPHSPPSGGEAYL